MKLIIKNWLWWVIADDRLPVLEVFLWNSVSPTLSSFRWYSSSTGLLNWQIFLTMWKPEINGVVRLDHSSMKTPMRFSECTHWTRVKEPRISWTRNQHENTRNQRTSPPCPTPREIHDRTAPKGDLREDSFACDRCRTKHSVRLEVIVDLPWLLNVAHCSAVVGLPMKRPLIATAPVNKRFRGDFNNPFPGDRYGGNQPYNYHQPGSFQNGNGGWPSRPPMDEQRQEFFERSNFQLQSIATNANEYHGGRSSQPMNNAHQYNHQQQPPFNGGIQHFNGPPTNYSHPFDRVSRWVWSATSSSMAMNNTCICSPLLLAWICLSSRTETTAVVRSPSSNESHGKQSAAPANASTSDAARGSVPFAQSESIRGFRWQSANQPQHPFVFPSI